MRSNSNYSAGGVGLQILGKELQARKISHHWLRKLGRKEAAPGQTTLEFVLVLPLLLFILLALLQFGITIYAQSVVVGAAQEGARVAAEADKGIADGVAVARRNISVGLGQIETEVTGSGDQEVVTIQVEATVPSFLPLLNQRIKFNLKAKANMLKEGWRS